MLRKISPGLIVKHYRNKQLYLVEGIGIHTETGEELISYRSLYETDKYPLL